MAKSGDSMAIKALDALGKINELICLAARNTAGLLLMAMTVIVLTQIVFRYVLNDSLIWTEEVSKTMMVWAAFLVAPWAYRYSANVSIEMFADELPRVLRKLLTLFLNVLVVWIIIVFWRESFGMVERGFTIRTASLPIQVGWFLMVVPFAFAATLLVGIELLIRDLLAIIFSERDFAIPEAGVLKEAE